MVEASKLSLQTGIPRPEAGRMTGPWRHGSHEFQSSSRRRGTMKAFRPVLASVALLAATGTAVLADPVTYQIDPSHSQVGFNVRHFFSRVPGRFNEFSGSVTYDDKDVSKSSVD